jgi:hypothetical protein
MPVSAADFDRELVLDANAVAGALEQIFGRDVTASLIACNQCGDTAALGTLKAFTYAPGVVLRCSTCEQVVLRFSTNGAASSNGSPPPGRSAVELHRRA